MENLFEQALEQESIFKDRDLISPHYTPEHLPNRENQIKEITSILAPTINAKKSNNLFIYGKVGTGKTSVTKHVLHQLKEFVDKNNAKVVSVYTNCRNHPSKYKVFLKCLKDLDPEKNFLGYSAGFVYEQVVDYVKKSKAQLIIVLDEIDKVKDLDDLVYGLTRANDELSGGGISIIGISNNVLFKDRLDVRTKSSLCEHEMVFPPYNAEELKEILTERAKLAFQENSVTEPAISFAAAIAAKESGDARTAVMLLFRAGEIADHEKKKQLTEKEVESARKKVEEEVIFNMVSTLPSQEQLVLLSVAALTLQDKGIKKINGEEEKGILLSGEVFEEYLNKAKMHSEQPVSSRWYRQYISELETYGLILTTNSGLGQRGQTRFIKLGFDAQKIKEIIEKELQN